MLFALMTYVPPIVGLTVISIFTLLKNYKQRVNILFFLFAEALTLWLIALLVGDLLANSSSLWAVRCAALIGTVSVPLFIYFGFYFPVAIKKPGVLIHMFAIAPTVLFMAVSLTPLLIGSVVIKQHTAQPDQVGVLYGLQSAYTALGLVFGGSLLIAKLKHVGNRERAQIKLVVAGLAATLFINLGTGYVLTALNVSNRYSNLIGSLAILILVGTTSYAIVKHRLFDMRLALVRIVGYVLTLSIVTSLYSFAVIVVGIKLLGIQAGRVLPLLGMLVVLTIFISLTFHRLQKFIAAMTIQVFHQQTYSLRAVLNQLTDVLVAEQEIKPVMRRSLTLLNDALQPLSSHIVVFDEQQAAYARYGTGQQLSDEAIATLQSIIQHGSHTITERHELTSKAKMQADALGTELILRLGTHRQPLGIVAFGPKKNGSIYTRQDIQLLEIAANNLALAIENARKYDQIQNFADTLKEEVAHATLRLRHANERLKTLDQLKDDFISMASHQFRTPVGSIRQALQIINDPTTSQKDQREMLHLAEVDSEHLSTIVATMLSISRLQAGRFLIDKSPTDLNALLDAVMRGVGVLAEQKNIQVNLHRPDDPLMMAADSAKLKEAMTNYIENAIKYSPAGSTVTVTLSQTDDAVVFEVADRGIGIPGDERKQLFTKFYRAPNARREQPEGNGIGLYVVKNIAELHGGIAYHKPAEPGSIFGFSLPLNTAGHSRAATAYEPLAQSPTIIE